MIRLSASGVPRALACPASLVLPQHRYHTVFAEAGTDRHADTEAAIDMGDADEVLPPKVIALMLPGDETTTECSFAYDCATDTARELGHGRESYKGLAPYETPGTIDVLIMGNGRAIVVDKKGFERVGAAERNEQTLTYALFVARTYGFDEVTVVIFYELGAPDIATIGALDLDAHAARLKALQFDVVRAAKDPTAFIATGRHCKYCEAYLSCPKQSTFQLEIASADSVMAIESRIPFHDDAEAAKAFDLLERIKMLTARLSAALYARAGERPFQLSNGNMFGRVDKEGKREIDADKAYQHIRAKWGQKVADGAVQRKVAQKWIEDALKAHGVKAPGKEKDAIIGELEKAGAVTRKKSSAIEEYPPKELKAG